MPLRTIRFFLLLSVLATAQRGNAFFPLGYTWNFGRDVVMHLDLGPSAQVLQDGSASWAESATRAMEAWNSQMNTVRLVPAGAVSSFFGDRVNTVRFSDTVYGQSFGDHTLAITILDRIETNPSPLCEAEVFFNKAKRFDSYTGPMQVDHAGPIFDFRRVALHEFGHCLGLLHPDEHNQAVVSIMNSVISDLDHLAEDDTTGIRSLYWMDVMGQTVVTHVTLAQPFSYQLVANNNASSFSATGLPPGLTINGATGLISGKPLKSGTYDIQVAAHGPSGTVSGVIRINIPVPLIRSSRVTFPILGEPFFYQIWSDLEAISFEAHDLPPGLTLNSQTGLISGVPTISGGQVPYNGTTVIAHGAYEDAKANVSMNVFLPLPKTTPPLKVLGFFCNSLVPDPVRGRIYGVTSPHSLRVIDGNTLSVIKEFPCNGILEARLANDGRNLWILRTGLKALSRLDLDALDQIVDVPAIAYLGGTLEGLDGRFYVAQGYDFLQLAAPEGPIQQRIPASGPTYPPQLALSTDKKTLFVGEAFLPGDGSLVSRATVARYDVSSAVPVLIQRVEMPAPHVQLTVAPDGASLYVKLGHFEGARRIRQRTLCLAAHDLTTKKGELSYEGQAGPLTITPDGKLGLQMVQVADGGSFTSALLEIFDTTTFALRRTIVLGSDKSFGVALSNAVLDLSGARIIAGVALEPGSTPNGVMAYSAELPPPPPPPLPKTLLNISTRLKTWPGEDSLIGGFILTGAEPKKVIVRAIGPSLTLPGKLLDPIVELRGRAGEVIVANDNWNEHRAQVLQTGIAPRSEYESAVVATLQPGPYTALLRGTGSSSGVAVLEIYDLSSATSSKLANISTRGKVDGGDSVMIGGFIVGGDQPTKVIVRALGPSLATAGIAGVLQDPLLEVYDGNGLLLAQDDDWRQHQEKQLIESGLPPTNDAESALFLILPPGAYTGIVRGKDNRSGVGLVEVYNLDAN